VRVLLTTVSLDAERGGGTAERTMHIARHLKALDTNCQVVAIEGGRYAEQLIANSIPVYITGSVRIRFQIPLLNILRLRQLVQQADVIHVLGYWNVLSAAICFLAHHAGKPYALSAAGEFAALEAPRPDQRVFHALLGKRMVAHASSIIAITTLERKQIVRQLGVEPERVTVISNGVEEAPASAEPDRVFPRGHFILFMGRLAPIKGPDLLLEAFAALKRQDPNLMLVFAGSDFGMRAILEKRVHELGLDSRVLFTGFADEHQRWVGYRRATLLAVPSRSEAMSLVALEAGAAGTPVLLTDQCGFNDVQTFGGGRVVTADVEGLRDGLQDMLADGADLVGMGQKLRNFVLASYAWPTVAKQLSEHLSQLRPRR